MNTTTNTNNTMNLTDKDILQDLLATEKQVVTAYSTGITESSCTNLRSTLVNNFNNVQNVQYRVFDAMRQKGWYPTKDAPQNEVDTIKTDAQQTMNSLR